MVTLVDEGVGCVARTCPGWCDERVVDECSVSTEWREGAVMDVGRETETGVDVVVDVDTEGTSGVAAVGGFSWEARPGGMGGCGLELVSAVSVVDGEGLRPILSVSMSAAW